MLTCFFCFPNLTFSSFILLFFPNIFSRIATGYLQIHNHHDLQPATTVHNFTIQLPQIHKCPDFPSKQSEPSRAPSSPDTCADASQPPTPVNSITETSDLSTRCHDPSHGRASVLPLPITSVDHTQSTTNHHLDFEIHPSRTAGFPIPCSAIALGSLSLLPVVDPSHGCVGVDLSGSLPSHK
ncbi:hypothetical protein M0R45_024303 [Rubus argutus]|uniref:Uncharacterized protein n=1 Tax=Rubus argutus TaxID=59490 RepID=A0AAW1WTX0_RUBAR